MDLQRLKSLAESKVPTYYDDFKSLKDTKDRWRQHGQKLYDRAMPLKIKRSELWQHREYKWSRDDARMTPQDWDELKASMAKHGWKSNEPLHINVGRTGGIKVGEGNHRLAIAKELGIKLIPVWIHFYSSRVTKLNRGYKTPPKHKPEPTHPPLPKRTTPLTDKEKKDVDDIIDLLGI